MPFALSVEMEDAWSVQLPLSSADASSAYFAVFDGHGSRHFSHHCGHYLHQVILDSPDFCKAFSTPFPSQLWAGQGLESSPSLNNYTSWVGNGEYGVALKRSFHSLDLAMKQGDSIYIISVNN